MISEFLPYELPIGFSNEGFYALLIGEGLRLTPTHAQFRRDTPRVRAILRLLLGPKIAIDPVKADRKFEIQIALRDLQKKTVPYNYRIRHGNTGFREMSIPHPRSQLAFVEFYEKYRSLITHYGQASPFSIRKPVDEARITVIRDDLFERLETGQSQVVETVGRETSRLRSFFVYQKFANLHEFYESASYQNAEKRFGQLLRLDVASCFDSIYTHSIEWAIYGRTNVKSNRSSFKATFPSEFDSRIRAMNEDETHGILIGPEVSRIFAELLLQRVDRDICDILKAEGFAHGADFIAFRYVDDFFFFHNSQELRGAIERATAIALRPYKLQVQAAKVSNVATPHLTPLSLAKIEIRKTTQSLLYAHFEEDSSGPALAEGYMKATNASLGLINAYKAIIAQTAIEPIDIANYALVQVEEALEAAIGVFIEHVPKPGDWAQRSQYEASLSYLVGSAIEYGFFIYSGSTLASPTVKISRIAALSLKAMDSLALSLDRQEYVRQLVYAEIVLQVARNPMTGQSSVEGLYLIDLLGELEDSYALPTDQLYKFLGCALESPGVLTLPDWMHSVAALSLLRYVNNQPVYRVFRKALEEWMLMRLRVLCDEEDDHAERSVLALDMLTCPHLDKRVKQDVVKIHGIKPVAVESLNPGGDGGFDWFTRWRRDDLHRDLLEKRSQGVY